MGSKSAGYFVTIGYLLKLFFQVRRARDWCSGAVNTQRTDILGVSLEEERRADHVFVLRGETM